MKKIFSILLTLFLMISIIAPASTVGFAEPKSGRIVYSVDDITGEISEKYYSLPQKFVAEKNSNIFASGLKSAPNNKFTYDQAAAFLRDEMVMREESNGFYLKINNPSRNDIKNLFYDVVNSDDYYTTPQTGSGLRKSWRTFSFDYYLYEEPNIYYCEFNVTYRTTLDEELKLTKEVYSLINKLNLRSLTRFQQIYSIYKYLTDNVKYVKIDGYDQTAYGALVNKKCVCAGYASAFLRLCRELGIECYYVAGTNSSGAGHAWNVVNFNGKYYYCDATWDAGKSADKFKNFLCGTSEFSTHKEFIYDNEYDSFFANHKIESSAADSSAYLTCKKSGSDHSYTYTSIGKNRHNLVCKNCNITDTQSCSFNDDNCVYCKEKHDTTARCTHYYEKYSYTAPTCTEKGKYLELCNTCGYKSNKYKYINAKGHGDTYEEIIPAKFTNCDNAIDACLCGDDGSITVYCDVCGEEIDFDVISAVYTPTLLKRKYEYNGKARKPGVTVKDTAGITLVPDSDYSVYYQKDCKSVGRHKVTVELNGYPSYYSGKKSIYYTVVPKNTSIKKLSGKKKSFTINIKKYTTQTTGYQIKYSTSKKFKSSKTVTISNKTTSKTIKKLKSKKKYYVRIRTYKKTHDGAKYYSSWSSTKTVKTK